MIVQAIKNYSSKFLFSICLCLALGSVSAFAQSQSTEKIVINVPFEFSVAGKNLPAGEYIIRQATQSGLCYSIQNRDGKYQALVTVSSGLRGNRDQERPSLVFNEYNGQRYLSQIWIKDPQTGYKLHTSRAERETQKMIAAGTKREVIYSSVR